MDLARTSAHVSVIRIGHFPGSIDHTTHDSNFDSCQVCRFTLNLFRGLLKVEEGPAAGRAGNEICLKHSNPGRLHEVLGKPCRKRLGITIPADQGMQFLGTDQFSQF